MPRLHVALTAALAMWLWTVRIRPWALLFALYTALTTLDVVYLGEHYLVDALAGVALAYFVVRVVTYLLLGRRFESEMVRAGHSRDVVSPRHSQRRIICRD
jgi:membrane-associated phospholipid phosphatase